MRDETHRQHDNVVIDQFSQQAIPFSKLPGHLDAMQTIIEMSGVGDKDSVLDVACGPGLVACEFAKVAHKVAGIDITEKILGEARKHQRQMKLENLILDLGHVLPLPYADSEFTFVLSRYAFHHFLEPKKVLGEMSRVCQPGGTVMVVDVALSDENVDAYNHMEKLRDPSHTRALTHLELEKLFYELELIHCKQGAYRVGVELEQQLQASFPEVGDDAKIRLLIQDDIGINAMGIEACKKDGAIHFSYPISIYVGNKPV